MNEEKNEELNGNNEDGLSIREICHIIGKKIWYVLGGSLLAAIAAVLIFMFALNPAKKYDSMSFQIDFPMSTERKYPDGSMFDYRDMVSRSVIEGAKNNSEYKDEFASLNVDKIMKDGAVSISARKTSDSSDASYVYTVSLKSSYFSGIDSEKFILALAESFSSFIEQKAKGLDYRLEEEIFRNASFKDQLTLLVEQKSVILKQYDDWIKEYNPGYVVKGKSLGSYRMEVATMLADNVKTPLENDLSIRGYEYFNSFVTAEEVGRRVKQLQEDLKRNKAILSELKSYYTEVSSQSRNRATTFAASDDGSDSSNNNGGSIIIMPGDSDLSQKMAYYGERVAIIQQQIVYLSDEPSADETTDFETHDFAAMAEEIKTFGKNFESQFNILNGRAETLRSVVSAIYRENTVVTFDSREVSSSGGTSIVIVGVGVFVVAFLVFALIAFLVGKKNLKSAKIAPVKTENTDAQNTENKE